MKERMETESIYRMLASSIRQLFEKAQIRSEHLQEIRMRTGRPLILRMAGEEYTVTERGELSEELDQGHRITAHELDATLESISGYSLYAFDEEMKQGFLTVQGGHRIGLAGRIVTAGRQISCIRHISFLNIRLSHEIIGCADSVMPHLLQNGMLCHTLIISPPGCGKTTLLRDIIRQVSDGTGGCTGHTVGVVDERSELAGCWLGVPQNDLGMRTDVLDCCPKEDGMMMLLRSMSPQVIAVDELGGSEDGYAVENVFRCGCRLIATVHGSSIQDVRQKKHLDALSRNMLFERYIVLSRSDVSGRRTEVFDADGELLYVEETGL